MIAVTVFVYLMFLPTGFAGCQRSYYFSNGECQPCPDHCVSCISNTNCTKCTDNYYGGTCQDPCPELDCECHKIHGHCTDSCPDGYFPEKEARHCSPCPDNCVLCSSLSTCVSCKHRFYGDTCAQRCSTNCKTCDKTTGNCIACDEGQFNEDGTCLRCPEGCVGCYDNRNCSGCKSGYLELEDGQCIKHCDGNVGGTFPSSNEENESNEVASSCENSLFGQDVEIQKQQPCIRNKSCPSNITCRTCGAMMIYQCTHVCRLENERTCSGEPKCRVVEGTIYNKTFCLDTKGTVSVETTAQKCDPVSEDDLQEPPSVSLVATFVALVVYIGIICVIALFFWKKRYYKNGTFLEASKEEEVDEENTHYLLTERVHKECKELQAESGLNQLSQDPPKMDETSSLNAGNLS